MATKTTRRKKMYVTTKEKDSLIKDCNNLLTKISKYKASITDSYQRDYLGNAYTLMKSVKSTIGVGL